MTADDDADHRESGRRHREAMAGRSRRLQSAVAEIGPIPPVCNPDRRETCRLDLNLFLTTYFPHSTGLKPFSEDHRRIIRRNQRVVLMGGRVVNAVFRGFAKTTISENTDLWATLYGHRRFAPIFGADQLAADDILDSIKMELETNDLLLDDFPEVCFPIRALEGKPQRCQSQTQGGRLTHIEWTASQIVYATIYKDGKPLPSSGAVIRAKGITGSFRGMKYKRPDGSQQRPDLVIGDDLQTDESAASPEQCRKRLAILRKSVAKLAGHDKTIAIIINATVIQKDDLIHQLLTEPEHAIYQSERVPMLKSFSSAHETLWLGDYATARRSYDPDDPDDQARAHKRATKIYMQHRREMDAGAEATWKHCYDEQTVSAVQYAYNLLIDDGEEAFASECQQDPLDTDVGEGALSAANVLAKLNGRRKGIVPKPAVKLTAHVDVHDTLLYWTVAAWDEVFRGDVLDYNTYPEQSRRNFTLRDAKRTLGRIYPGRGKDAAIVAGLVTLLNALLGRAWTREDKGSSQIDLILVDGQYKPDQVEEALRIVNQPTRVKMSQGQPLTPHKRPIGEWKYKKGDVRGLHWGEFRRQNRIYPVIQFCANRWKSKLRDLVLADRVDPGSVGIYGRKQAEHKELSEHWASEKPHDDEGQYGRMELWELRPNKQNHLYDNAVGNLVAASRLGIRLPGSAALTTPRKSRRKKRAAKYF